MEKSLRYRVKTTISVKGQITWENTVDGEGYTEAEILEKSDSLVKALEQRYPPTMETK
ncbi:hypothetical protein LCGC14_2580150 [marine sediment metagenome]|uniref:Uncharacterized protein n=1 Tax=marine sediment metagenome TaxID=412755 RepID=A0A0F9D7E2_9ZZZZ